MRYEAEVKIENRFLTERTRIKIYREVAISIVKELPIDKLKQLFNLKVVCGFKRDLEEAYRDNDRQKATQIQRLIKDNSSLFTG
ncbi:MAG: hypothetical protein IMY72_11865 [Bacteroidetes bacterium]|nr:hypothetical protein [Bacteroidota bacterium]